MPKLARILRRFDGRNPEIGEALCDALIRMRHPDAISAWIRRHPELGFSFTALDKLADATDGMKRRTALALETILATPAMLRNTTLFEHAQAIHARLAPDRSGILLDKEQLLQQLRTREQGQLRAKSYRPMRRKEGFTC